MERFLQTDNNVLVRYTPQRSSMDPSSSSSSLQNSGGEVDFHDVFGGPPRRYSSQDARHSTSEARELSRFRGGGEETVISGSVRWSGLGDRPVFGEEGGTNRRRYPSEDLFDDIFRGGEGNKDPYASSPGSRIMSPARTIPPSPKSDPFASSLRTQFRLPAKVNKGMDLPSFASPNRNRYSNKDDPQNGPSEVILNLDYQVNH